MMFNLILAVASFSSIFNNHMVLQRGMPVPVWGNAEPNERVVVKFAGQQKSVQADESGVWLVRLDAMEAIREGQTLSANEAKLEDVVVGEVWLCSGQSNMNLRIFGLPVVSYHAEQAADMGYVEGMVSNRPEIRCCRVPDVWAAEPTREYPNRVEWSRFEPGVNFSAIGFHFAKILNEALDVPVGVINCAWGGASIDGFINAAGYKSVPELAQYATSEIKTLENNPHTQPRATWNAKYFPMVPMAFKGALWYQGESDIWKKEQYRLYLRALWNGWCKAFKHPNMPFFVAQIAPHDYNYIANGDADPLARRCEIWEAQSDFGRENPAVGFVSTIDIGEHDNIHCHQKRIVALRFAAQVLNRVYGRSDIRWESPELVSARASGNEVTLEFSNVNRWQMYGNAYLPFEFAGADGNYVAVSTNTVVFVNSNNDNVNCSLKMTSPVASPKSVRYAWSWLHNAKLKNYYGYPVPPFKAEISE